jgi:hypothetical protein
MLHEFQLALLFIALLSTTLSTASETRRYAPARTTLCIEFASSGPGCLTPNRIPQRSPGEHGSLPPKGLAPSKQELPPVPHPCARELRRAAHWAPARAQSSQLPHARRCILRASALWWGEGVHANRALGRTGGHRTRARNYVKHTRAHTRSRAHMRTHMRTHARAHTHAHTHAHTRARARAQAHTRSRTHAARKRTHMRTHARARARTLPLAHVVRIHAHNRP